MIISTTSPNLLPESETSSQEPFILFLFYDSGTNNRTCMLMFGADTALQHLARTDIWMKDGTFDVEHLTNNMYY